MLTALTLRDVQLREQIKHACWFHGLCQADGNVSHQIWSRLQWPVDTQVWGQASNQVYQALQQEHS